MSSPEFQWVAHQRAVERLLALRPGERAVMISEFDRLAANPYAEPDASFHDAAGCPLSTRIIGKRVVTYHVDHAVKQVQILAIE